MKPNFGEGPGGQSRKPQQVSGKGFNFDEVVARAKRIQAEREAREPKTGSEGNDFENQKMGYY